jgi:peptidoglycan/xylan/chitin deacetylase (PgdA/CDA1 family)
LRQQLSWLARATTVLDLAPVLDRLRAGEPLPPRTTVLTFDDGYADNLALAVPVLERLGLPATFFLVPGLLSRQADPWWERISQAVALTQRQAVHWDGWTGPLTSEAQRAVAADRLRSSLKTLDRVTRADAVSELVDQLGVAGAEDPGELFLDWDGARQLVRRGFSVGSHTWHHGVLSRETPEEQERDLSRARADLENGLQVEVPLLAYPNGGPADYDAHSIAAARSTGHVGACTTVPGTSRRDTPPYELRRYVMSPRRGVLELAKAFKPGPSRSATQVKAHYDAGTARPS